VKGFLGEFFSRGIPPLQRQKIASLGFLCRLVVFLCLGFTSKRRGEPSSELPESSILPIFEQKLASFLEGLVWQKIGSDLKSRETLKVVRPKVVTKKSDPRKS
jgi:hypothetical protein